VFICAVRVVCLIPLYSQPACCNLLIAPFSKLLQVQFPPTNYTTQTRSTKLDTVCVSSLWPDLSHSRRSCEWLKSHQCILLSTTNKIQRIQYSLLLSMLYMLRAVSPPIIRSSKTVHTASGICQACLLSPLGGNKQAWHIPNAVCTVFELLMMGGGTARNM
jgi:hypothetical protein